VWQVCESNLEVMYKNVEHSSIRASIRGWALSSHDKKIAQDFLDE
jgi:hypothetical protein